MFAGVGGAGTGFAADRFEAALVQRVVGRAVAEDVVPDLLGAEVGERVEFDPGAVGLAVGLAIELDDGQVGAGTRALVLALAGGEGGDACEGAGERLDLADAAALGVSVAAEGEQPFFAHQRFEGWGPAGCRCRS